MYIAIYIIVHLFLSINKIFESHGYSQKDGSLSLYFGLPYFGHTNVQTKTHICELITDYFLQAYPKINFVSNDRHLNFFFNFKNSHSKSSETGRGLEVLLRQLCVCL